MMVDGRSTASGDDDDNHLPCDACPCCADVCNNAECSACLEKSNALQLPQQQQQQSTKTFTACQVRRHDHAGSAWIVAGKNVYDVTTYLDRHPAGSACILSMAGGRHDAMSSLKRHKRYAQKKWHLFRIGTLKKCDREKLFGGGFCCGA
jgi:cytochrome b involved in lipid metabolism